MKFIKLLVYILLFSVAVYFHTAIFRYFLESKISYTYSMIIPYIFEFILICLITYEVFNLFLRGKTLWIRRIGILTTFGGLSGLAFSMNVIYDGDFGSIYNPVTVSGESQTVFQEGLTMVALPGCPYCHEKLESMKYINSIYPNAKMHVLVVNPDLYFEENDGSIFNNETLYTAALTYEDSVKVIDSIFASQRKENLKLQAEDDSLALENYKRYTNENITVSLFPKKLISNEALNTGSYPTLFYKISDTELHRWSNDNFGSAAWDFVISQVKK